jgi:LIVCS family branched-chain amino acid:cation transporter
LLLIYGGLIFSGAKMASNFTKNASRIEILTELSAQTLGDFGTSFLCILVALACFTTAVGIVTGVSDYIKGICKNSQKSYIITAAISCLIGVIVGSFNVGFIIDIAVPALMLLYPITIVLILLNIVPKKYSSVLVFRVVVLVTFVFSIPDFLGFVIPKENLTEIIRFIPYAKYSLGWALPAFFVFLLANIFSYKVKSMVTK